MDKKGETSLFRSKHGIALVSALALLFLAVPRVAGFLAPGLSSVFAFGWLAFAYLVIAANWRMVLQLDREERRKNERARRMRWLRAEKQKRSMAGSTSSQKELAESPLIRGLFFIRHLPDKGFLVSSVRSCIMWKKALT